MSFLSGFDTNRSHAFRKETVGTVVQFFNEQGKMTFQRFEAGDDCQYFDNQNNPISPPTNERYPGFDMVDADIRIDPDE